MKAFDELTVDDIKTTMTSRTTRARRDVGYLEVAVRVTNSSRRETLFVVTSMRSIDYDEHSRTLVIGTMEGELPPTVRMLHFVPPPIKTLLPGESCTLQFEIPLKLTRITGMAKDRVEKEMQDISGFKRIILRLGVGKTAFRPIRAPDLESLRRQLKEWQQPVERVITNGGTTTPRTNP